MRRFSILSLLAAVSAVGVLAFAATAASAETGETYLCKTKPTNHICREPYPAGTLIKSKLAPGTTLKVMDEHKIVTVNTCTSSELNYSLFSQGKLEALITNKYFTASGCTEPTNSYAMESPIGTVNHIANTDNGRMYGRSEIEFPAKIYGLWSANCRFQMTEAELVGGTEPKIVYNGGLGYLVRPGQSEQCPAHVRFYGTYNISSPAPLYVEE